MTEKIIQQRDGDTVVVDTETLALDKRALVLTLSAVRFNRHAQDIDIVFDNGKPFVDGETTLHLKLNVTEQLLAGRTVDPGTVAWWNGRSTDARGSIIHGQSVPLREALMLFTGFIQGAQLFARGTNFDPPILATLFEDAGLLVPWRFNELRDVRTYIDALSGGTLGYLAHWQTPDWFVSHHSLHDCIRDAMQMQAAGACPLPTGIARRTAKEGAPHE